MRKTALNLCLTTAAISINILALPQTPATARGICQIKYLENDIMYKNLFHISLFNPFN